MDFFPLSLSNNVSLCTLYCTVQYYCVYAMHGLVICAMIITFGYVQLFSSNALSQKQKQRKAASKMHI